MSRPLGSRWYGLVDIGGTKTIVAVAEESAIRARERFATEVILGPDDLTARIAAAWERLALGLGLSGLSGLAGLGVSVPGPVDVDRGVVRLAVNTRWKDYRLVDRLRQLVPGVPVVVDDDSNCAGLGEAFFGAGWGTPTQCYVTVSTGIGGALILDGRLYRGFQFAAGEIGHMPVMADGPLCQCGNRGCLEAISSGTAIAQRARERLTASNLLGVPPEAITAEEVFAAASRGHTVCQEIVADAAKYLGIGLASLVQLLNPPLIVLGGGVMNHYQELIAAIRKHMDDHLFAMHRGPLRIVHGVLGEDGGLLGALHLLTTSA
jgi:glucokinase